MNGDKKRGIAEHFVKFVEGRGFYIVLLLCVAVVGVAAWTLNISTRKTGQDLEAALENTLNDLPTITMPEQIPVTEPDLYVPEEPTIAAPIPAPAAATPAPTPQPVPEQSAEPEKKTSAIPASFIRPVNGSIERPHSVESLTYDRTMRDWRTHRGIDIAAPLGEKVRCVAAGVVESVIIEPLYGVSVTVLHDGGLRSVYRNLAEEPPVGDGQELALGDVVGAIGQTASAEIGDVTHLHFEMTLNNEQVNPADYLPQR
ncbi:MAG: M23 family metallopeptidase [Oscillospiraceae bacterium]|jgi:murein DD-endopeptidase MepM/ murein hydrolase activator NlpD|nr:M23 family metallopeptidase [Oscillospiraceae bacterium]